MANDISEQLVNEVTNFSFFPLSMDESTDVNAVAQSVWYVLYVEIFSLGVTSLPRIRGSDVTRVYIHPPLRAELSRV